MKVVFAVWNTGLAGGVRMIFELANRLNTRNYTVEIIALGGDHSWYPVKVPIKYIEVPSRMRLIFYLYKLATFRFKKKHTYLSVEEFAKRLGFSVDLIKILAIAIPDADITVATWYPTALALWLSGKGKQYYLVQDFPELVIETGGIYGLRLFELTLRLPFYFLANSTYTKELVMKYQPNARVKVVGVGVDLQTFYPRKRIILNSARGRQIVMLIVRGMGYKGDDVGIKALNIVNSRK